MLRVEIAELLMDIEGKKFDEDSLKVDLMSLLEDEGVEVEEWPSSVSLEKIVNLNGTSSINMSAARILYHLDTEAKPSDTTAMEAVMNIVKDKINPLNQSNAELA